MSRDRIDAIGFQHPPTVRRTRSLRGAALAELAMTVALVFSIVVAATAVSIGIARADDLVDAGTGHDGTFAAGIFLGLLMAAMGAIAAAVSRPGRETTQDR